MKTIKLCQQQVEAAWCIICGIGTPAAGFKIIRIDGKSLVSPLCSKCAANDLKCARYARQAIERGGQDKLSIPAGITLEQAVDQCCVIIPTDPLNPSVRKRSRGKAHRVKHDPPPGDSKERCRAARKAVKEKG